MKSWPSSQIHDWHSLLHLQKPLGSPVGLYGFPLQWNPHRYFAQFGSDLDADTKARLEQGQRIVEVLKQGRNEPIAVELQIAIIYAVVNNLLKDVAIEDISAFEKGLFEYLTATRDDLLAEIRGSGVLTDETTAALRDSILAYKEKFLNKA